MRYLAENTDAAARVFGVRRLRFRDLVRHHLARRGVWDHLLAAWLAIPTLGLTAWAWKRWFASCPFAGFIDAERTRAGCLIHPLRIGEPDLRRHAFPLIPTLGCNRDLRCGLLTGVTPVPENTDLLSVARAGASSRAGKSGVKPPHAKTHNR